MNYAFHLAQSLQDQTILSAITQKYRYKFSYLFLRYADYNFGNFFHFSPPRSNYKIKFKYFLRFLYISKSNARAMPILLDFFLLLKTNYYFDIIFQ